jgi:hypothetical protein
MDSVVLSRRRTARGSTARRRCSCPANPYGTGHIADLDRWFRLDRGVAGMTVITVRSARQAACLGVMP